MAITNKEINLSQLNQELGGKGLIADFNDLESKLILPAEGSGITEKQLEAAIAKHNAISEEAEAEAKATAKAELLAKLGITAEEAALLLG